jgi:hypothetical protein
MLTLEPKHKRKKLTVTTGWAQGKEVTLEGFAEGQRGLLVQNVGTSTTVISGKPGKGDVLVRLDKDVYGCFYRNLNPMPCRILLVSVHTDLDALDRVEMLTPLADLGLQFLPKDHKRMASFAKRLCKLHGDFAWLHFCRDEAVVILGVSRVTIP